MSDQLPEYFPNHSQLLAQARALCAEIEKLPAGEHQTNLSVYASTVAHALQQLQREGQYVWRAHLFTGTPALDIPEVGAGGSKNEMQNRRGEFAKELESLINKHCQENESDTPDFILAGFLRDCLSAWNASTRDRERWYGRSCGNGAAILATSKPVSG